MTEVVWRADDYLDLRARHPDALRRAERAGLVRVIRDADRDELIVLVTRQGAPAEALR